MRRLLLAVRVRDLRLRRRHGPDRPDAHAPRRRAPNRAGGVAAGRRGRAAGDRRPARSLGRRRAHDPERDEHHVAADRAAAELAVRVRSAVPLFLRRPRRCVGSRATASRRASAPAWSSRATATSSPTTTSSATRAPQVSVVLPDKRELKAKIIGVDEWTDIALLKIDARGLPVLPWGDSSKLKVAEWVLAIGNPFQLNQTVTLGIVSALGRSLGGSARDLRGLHPDRRRDQPRQLRRRAGQRARRADRHQHRDLQRDRRLPGDRLRRAEQPGAPRHGRPAEVRRGPARRRCPASSIAPLTTQIAEDLGAPNTRGALVNQMSRDSDAYVAGLRPGDIIITFNGRTGRRRVRLHAHARRLQGRHRRAARDPAREPPARTDRPDHARSPRRTLITSRRLSRRSRRQENHQWRSDLRVL